MKFSVEMDYYFETCDIVIKPKRKYRHFKLNIHRGLDECKHIKHTIENPDIIEIDNVFHAYIIQHNKKYDYYLIECEYKIVCTDYQCCPYITFKLFDNKTLCSWQNFLVKVVNYFKNKG